MGSTFSDYQYFTSFRYIAPSIAISAITLMASLWILHESVSRRGAWVRFAVAICFLAIGSFLCATASEWRRMEPALFDHVLKNIGYKTIAAFMTTSASVLVFSYGLKMQLYALRNRTSPVI
jgi:hypothetical protein